MDANGIQVPTTNKAKGTWEVSVTSTREIGYQGGAAVEAIRCFNEGEIVVHFDPGPNMEKDLALTIRDAFLNHRLQSFKFDPRSRTQGQVVVSWKGRPFPVAFWVSLQGPEVLYSRVGSAIHECVSRTNWGGFLARIGARLTRQHTCQ